MLDTEIHKGLSKSEIRDFLSKSMIDAYNKNRNSTKKWPSSNNLSSFDWSIERVKVDIFNFQKELEMLEKYKTINILAETHNWEEYDVSDYVTKTDDKLAMSFFGTQEEYDALIKKLNLR